MTSSRAPGIFFAMYSPGARKAASRSPTTISVGTRATPPPPPAAPAAGGVQAARLELAGTLLGSRVPGLARRGVPVARAGVADDERSNHLGMAPVKGERRVSAERKPPDHRAPRSEVEEERSHVGHGRLDRVPRGIGGALRASASARVPRRAPGST